MSHRQILETMSGLLLGMFVAILSSTVVSNALPTIVSDLQGSESGYTWVVTSTLLATTISTPIWGKLADLFSKKVLIQVALVIFTLASIVAGLSQSMTMLITTRVFQGLGAGGLTALTQVILATIVSPRERGRYSGYLGATFALGTVTGPLIGGFLTEHLSWHWCFYVGVPFAVLAIFVLQATLHLPVTRHEAQIDYLGAILLSGGVASLLIWVTLAGDKFDWWSWQTGAMVGGGIVLLALTVMAERIAPQPLIPLRLFRRPTIVLSSLASLFVGIGMFGGTVFLGQYFQMARGETPTRAGLMTIPMIAGLFLASMISGQLITRTGRWKGWLVAGGLLLTAGLGLMGTVAYDTDYWIVAGYMLLLGAGVGMMMQNLVVAVQNEVEPHDLGAASSFVAFTRSLGGAIGVSALGAVLGNRLVTHIKDAFAAAGIHFDVMSGHGSALPNLAQLPEPVRTLVQDSYGQAIAEVFLAAAPFALLAFLIVLFVREVPLRTNMGPVAHKPEDEAVTEQTWNTPEDHVEPAEHAVGSAFAIDGVVRAAGSGVPGAHVTLAQDGVQVAHAVSAGDGSYRIDARHAGTFLLIVAADRYAPVAGVVGVDDRGSRHDVELSGRASLGGHVWRSGGDTGDGRADTPEAGARITLSDATGQVLASAVTGNDGSFHFAGRSAGTHILTISAGTDRPRVRTVDLHDNQPSTCDVTLGAGGHLTGIVTAHSDGRPLREANVTLTDSEGRVLAGTVTDDDGRYRFDRVESGSYTLTTSGFAPVAQAVEVHDHEVTGQDVQLGTSVQTEHPASV